MILLWIVRGRKQGVCELATIKQGWLLEVGDLVAMPCKLTYGGVTGDFLFDAEDPGKLSHLVIWYQESVTGENLLKADMDADIGGDA